MWAVCKHQFQLVPDSRRVITRMLQLSPHRMEHVVDRVLQFTDAGDDEPDVSALEWAQLSFAPANAHDCAKAAANHITERRGGEGAVREICDAILAQRSPA